MQSGSLDMAGFLHVLTQIAFWKFLASGAERTLPRAVNRVIDAVVAAYMVRCVVSADADELACVRACSVS